MVYWRSSISFSTLKMKETYKLSEKQKSAIEEARNQIKNGDYLTKEQDNQEIDKWLDE